MVNPPATWRGSAVATYASTSFIGEVGEVHQRRCDCGPGARCFASMEHHMVTGVQQAKASAHSLPASCCFGWCRWLAKGHPFELEHRVAADHHRRTRSMINPRAHGFSLKLGKPCSQRPHSVNWVQVLIYT
jgi:hypothetical protein